MTDVFFCATTFTMFAKYSNAAVFYLCCFCTIGVLHTFYITSIYEIRNIWNNIHISMLLSCVLLLICCVEMNHGTNVPRICPDPKKERVADSVCKPHLHRRGHTQPQCRWTYVWTECVAVQSPEHEHTIQRWEFNDCSGPINLSQSVFNLSEVTDIFVCNRLNFISHKMRQNVTTEFEIEACKEMQFLQIHANKFSVRVVCRSLNQAKCGCHFTIKGLIRLC